MTVERDRDWYQKQVELLEREIDRVQEGWSKVGDRPLDRCLVEMEICTRALADLDAKSPRNFH